MIPNTVGFTVIARIMSFINSDNSISVDHTLVTLHVQTIKSIVISDKFTKKGAFWQLEAVVGDV